MMENSGKEFIRTYVAIRSKVKEEEHFRDAREGGMTVLGLCGQGKHNDYQEHKVDDSITGTATA